MTSSPFSLEAYSPDADGHFGEQVNASGTVQVKASGTIDQTNTYSSGCA